MKSRKDVTQHSAYNRGTLHGQHLFGGRAGALLPPLVVRLAAEGQGSRQSSLDLGLILTAKPSPGREVAPRADGMLRAEHEMAWSPGAP